MSKNNRSFLSILYSIIDNDVDGAIYIKMIYLKAALTFYGNIDLVRESWMLKRSITI